MIQTFVEALTVLRCWNCGIAFGITSDFERRRRDDHECFYCPSGHGNYFTGKSEKEQLKVELQQAQSNLTYYRDANNSLHTKLTTKEHQIRSLKGAKTRMVNRVKNGVCPCCNRTFLDLQRHMTTKHPDYV